MRNYIKLVEDADRTLPYLIKVCNSKNPTKTVKQYIITDLQDWCTKKGVDFNDVGRAISTGSPIKGAKNVYRVGRYRL